MRLLLLLTLTLIATVTLTLFPDVASQLLRVEAFGWQFETQQGAFVVVLLLLLALLWLLRRILSALIAGPGQLWQTLKLGGRQRREQRLKQGVVELINMQGEHGRKQLAKGKGLLPDWGLSLLQTLASKNHEISGDDEDALQMALKARIATDPNAKPMPDVKVRRVLLEQWLAAYPDAPLAMIRKADLALEEQDWQQAATLLERIWKRGLRPATAVKPQLATAWLHIAESAGMEAGEYYRKAHRLMPHQSDVVLMVGQYKKRSDGDAAAWQLWLGHLQTYDDVAVATAAYDGMKGDALSAFKRIEKIGSGTPALQWLKAQVADAAGLDGLATETMQVLLDENPRAIFWQTQAQWMQKQGKWQQAAEAFAKALSLQAQEVSNRE